MGNVEKIAVMEDAINHRISGSGTVTKLKLGMVGKN